MDDILKQRIEEVEEKIKLRIKELVDEGNYSETSFAKTIGIPQRTLNRQLDEEHFPKLDTIIAIIDSIPNISLDWLFLGSGPKYRDSYNDIQMTGEKDLEYERHKKSVHIPLCAYEKLPVYEINSLEGKDTDNMQPESLFPFKDAQSDDMVIRVHGKAMHPIYPASCYLHIRKIKEWKKCIEFGQTYLLKLVENRYVLRNVHKANNNNSFLLRATNPDFDEMDVDFKLIKSMYLVIAKYEKFVM